MQATGIEASACARLLRLRLRLWLSCRFCSDSAVGTVGAARRCLRVTISKFFYGA